MRQILRGFIIVTLLGLASACSTLPRETTVVRAGITPSELEPSDTAVMSVQLLDGLNRVRKVHGVIKQDPSLTFKLKDDGISPDAVAGDGIWTLQVDVPFNAPPGDFVLTMSMLDERGEPVLVQNEFGEIHPLTASFSLVIRYPRR